MPPGSTGEGGRYRCSCPRPATRKSPAAENLRLLTKPTWRGQDKVRGSHSLLLPPREGDLHREIPHSPAPPSPTSPFIPTGCPRGAPASEIPHHTSRASRWRCRSLEQRRDCHAPRPEEGSRTLPDTHPQTPAPKQPPHTCSQEVTVAQGSHRRYPVWLLQALGVLHAVCLPGQHQWLLLRQSPQGYGPAREGRGEGAEGGTTCPPWALALPPAHPSSAPDTMCSSLMSWIQSMEPLQREQATTISYKRALGSYLGDKGSLRHQCPQSASRLLVMLGTLTALPQPDLPAHSPLSNPRPTGARKTRAVTPRGSSRAARCRPVPPPSHSTPGSGCPAP